MGERIFNELLCKVGGQGRYQLIVLIVMSMQIYTVAASIFCIPFLLYQAPYTCPADISQCTKYVCSLPASQQSPYLPSKSTMIDRFHDYRCEDSDGLATAQALIYIGLALGNLIGLISIKGFTHYRVLVVSSVLCIFGLALTLLASSLYLALVGLFINCTGSTLMNETLNSFMVESTAESIRIKYMMIMYIVFASSSCLVSLFYWLFQSWQLALGLTHLLPLVICLVIILLILQDTVFDLVSCYSIEQILKALQNISRINAQPCLVSQRDIQAICIKYEQMKIEKGVEKTLSIIDLFCFRSLIGVILISMSMRFLINFQFFGSQLFLSDYSGNLYLTGVITGASELIAVGVMFFVINSLPRKLTLFISEALSLLIATLLFVFLPCLQSDHCSGTEVGLQTAGLFLLRMIITFAHNLIYIWKTEALPTQVRLIGLQFTALVGRLAIIAVPACQRLLETLNTSVILSLAVTGLLALLVTLGIKETLGVEPPEVIQQLKEMEQPRECLEQSP